MPKTFKDWADEQTRMQEELRKVTQVPERLMGKTINLTGTHTGRVTAQVPDHMLDASGELPPGHYYVHKGIVAHQAPQAPALRCTACQALISPHKYITSGLCGKCETMLKRNAAAKARTAMKLPAEEYAGDYDSCSCSTCGSPPCNFCENSFECERCGKIKHNSKMECTYHPEIVCIYCAEQEREYGGDVASTPAADVGCKPESNLTEEEKKVDKDKLMESIRNACRGR